MRVLLTGATGFVGRAVLEGLDRRGAALRLLVRNPARIPPGKGWEIRAADLSRPATLAGACRGVDAVIHLAGLVDARSKAGFWTVNQAGTAALAREAARQASGLRWIQVSSLAATGPGDPVRDGDPPHPVSAYGRSKLAGEAAVAEAGLENRVVLRPCAVYGPGDRAFLPFFRAVQAGIPIPIPRRGAQRLSLLHVGDLARAVLAALESEARPPVALHLAHPRPVSVRTLLDLIGESLGRAPRRIPFPGPLAWGAAALATPLRRLSGRPAFFSLDKMHEILAPAWCCESTGAGRFLGWQAEWGLQAGLLGTVRQYRLDGLLREG
ncbi:MAG: NAD-dependent epimerase/dehydratase family protein [Planctomycetota bacterium]